MMSSDCVVSASPGKKIDENYAQIFNTKVAVNILINHSKDTNVKRKQDDPKTEWQLL